MSGFSESSLEKKFAELNASAQSIQQLSLWLIHHKKHHEAAVKVWYQQINRISQSRKLTFLYLANDVVQNSKKKFPDYAKEFGRVMKSTLEHLSVLTLDEKTVKAIDRLLKIWQERTIFDPKIQTDMNRIWATKTLEMAVADKSPKSTPVKKHGRPSDSSQSPHHKKKVRVELENSASKSKDRRESSENKSKVRRPSSTSTTEEQQSMIQDILDTSTDSTTKEGDVSLGGEDEDGLGSQSPSNAAAIKNAPEPEILIKALQDLENTASADATIRGVIAQIPPEVSEVSKLDKLKSLEEGQSLLKQVDNAKDILTKYNGRLSDELAERKKVEKMLSDFLAKQRHLAEEMEEKLEKYREKLEKVTGVRNDIRAHIQSLPDLPDVLGGGLAPLPSAGDLFTLK